MARCLSLFASSLLDVSTSVFCGGSPDQPQVPGAAEGTLPKPPKKHSSGVHQNERTPHNTLYFSSRGFRRTLTVQIISLAAALTA